MGENTFGGNGCLYRELLRNSSKCEDLKQAGLAGTSVGNSTTISDWCQVRASLPTADNLYPKVREPQAAAVLMPLF